VCKIILIRQSTFRVISQAISRRVSTAAAWIRTQVTSCGIYGEQGSIEAGFLRVLRFPLPILIPPMPHAPYQLSSTARTKRYVPSG
jgi:hypothetical protein